jgi:chromosome segregation ATPase
MANEDEVVYRTDRIANAMVTARGTLEAVARATSEPSFDRMLARRLEDLETLRTAADRVRAAEEAARSVENDENSTDDQRYDAGLEVRKAFWGAQQAAGVLMERIRESKSEVGGLGEVLKEGSDAIDSGIEHLTKLEELPGRTNSETMQLRVRLTNLRNAVTMAQGTLDRAMTRLESARTTAVWFEVSASESSDKELRSVMVDRTSSQLETDVSVAREGLKGLSGQVTIAAPGAHEAAIQSTDMAKAAWAAAQNPTPKSAQRVSGSTGEQEYRPGASGPSRGTNLDR